MVQAAELLGVLAVMATCLFGIGWAWKGEREARMADGKCGACQGSGQIRVTVVAGGKPVSEVKDCPACGGTGLK